ncbi:MAG: hypothetical protein ACRYGR_01865 [Janthinobacterium lividum]
MSESDGFMADKSKRLRVARALSGLTREAFSKKYDISVYTLRSCELGHLIVSYKTADKVSKALEEEGIFCTTEWIMEGKGHTPSFQNNKNNYKNLSLLSEEDTISQEIDFFRKLHDSSIVVQIKDDAMAPIYKIGDVIGGKLIEDHNQLIGKACLIETKPDHFILRKITKDQSSNEPWILTALNPETKCVDHYLRMSKITSAAPVLWTRRSLTSALE